MNNPNRFCTSSYNKVAIYCRLSEEDRNKLNPEDDSNSIQNQKTMLIQYAMDQGWDIYNIYSDDDYAGSDRRRPEFNKLLRDAEVHKFDIVLCKTQSRFTRELEMVEKYIHGLFPLWGIRFVSIVDNADTAITGNKKSRQINGLVNEWYIEDMSDNIKSVLTNKRINGQHIGAFALYGYQKDPDQKGHLIIDEEAAAVVREVFMLFSCGYGKTAIARILNDKGIPNPTEYKRLKGLRYRQPKDKNSTLWRYFAISDMLTNEIYIGNMVQGRYGSISYKTKENKPRPKNQWYIVEGTHEPIIDQELWDTVQAMLKDRAKPCYNGEIGLFARKVRCANCGYTMRSSKSRGRHYLKCSNRHVSADSCNGAFIPVKTLERIIIAELNRLSLEYLNMDELEQKVEFNNDMEAQKKSVLENIVLYQKRIAELSKAVREVYMDKVKGIINESDFITFSRDFTADRSRYEQMLANCQLQLDELNERIAAGDNRKEIIAQYVNVEHLTRDIVNALIDYIEVGRRIPGTTIYPVTIHWNF